MKPLALALLSIVAVFPGAASAAPGTVDQSFGRSGVARIAVGDLQPETDLLAQAPGGRIVVGARLFDQRAARGTSTYSLYALTAAGTLDPHFGHRGRIDDLPGGSATMRPDGTVALASVLDREGGSTLQVRSFTAAGKRNARFGRNGFVSVPVQTANPYTPEIAAAADGGVLVALNTMRNGNIETVTLVRVRADGVLDTTFGDGGQVLLSVLPDELSVPKLAVQRSGRIVVIAGRVSHVGLFGQGTFMAGLLPDGRLDPAFGTDGTATRKDLDPNALALTSDDRIVIAETGFDRGQLSALVRWLPSDLRGTEATALMPTEVGAVATSLAIDSRGAALTSLEISGGTSVGAGIARATPAGFDRAFSDGTPLIGGLLGAGGSRAIGLQRDGRILVAADDPRYVSPDSAVVVQRVWGGYDTRRPAIRLARACRSGRPAPAVIVADDSALASLTVRSGKRAARFARKRARLRTTAGRRLTARAVDASGNAARRSFACRH